MATLSPRHISPSCQRASHHVFGRRQPQPSAFPVGYRQRRHLGVDEIIEHLAHLAQEYASPISSSRSLIPLCVPKT
jgi:hypothetical protein